MITFATALFGDNQINCLYALLQSISKVYQKEVCVIVYYASVSPENIREIKRKAPSVFLREDKSLDYSSKNFECRASFKTVGWCKIIEEQRWPEYLVFLDVDTLVVKKVDKYFDKYFGCKDIGFTFKTHEDENLNWPINSGVILVRNNDCSLKFFRCWRDRTLEILRGNKKQRSNFTRLWGGEDQAALGDILGTRNRKSYSEGVVSNCILFQGFPCEELNETRCVPITEKTHIIHYKGWWHQVLVSGEFSSARPQKKCAEMYKFWKQTLEEWNKR